MSIQTEINRLNTAKTNILNSISNKGVDTSSVSTLDDIPSLIDSIVGEGNGGDYNIVTTIDGNTQELAITDAEGGGGSTEIEDSIITRTITSYTNDRITIIGAQAFRGSKITSISCPNVTSVEAYGLDSCTSLVDVNLPKVNSLKNYAMQNCKALVRLEFPNKITTQGAVWTNCTALTTLILRGSTMSGLGNKNCLQGTPIASGTGYVYVPDNLVNNYKSATNWSTYASQIKPISELEV